MTDGELNAFGEALASGTDRLEDWLAAHSETECDDAISALVAVERDRFAMRCGKCGLYFGSSSCNAQHGL